MLMLVLSCLRNNLYLSISSSVYHVSKPSEIRLGFLLLFYIMVCLTLCKHDEGSTCYLTMKHRHDIPTLLM